MATQDQKQQFEKMTYWAAIVSSWARMQYLQARFYPGCTYTGFSNDEVEEHQFLCKWWRGLGHGDRENIMRIAKDMARDVPTKHMRFIESTKNEHNDKVVKAGGYL